MRRRISWMIMGILVAGQTLGQIPYAEIEIRKDRIHRIDEHIEHYVQQGWLPGGVFAIARKGEMFYHKAFGIRDINGGQPYRTDDLFRIASMTKAVTTVGIMQLIERGKLGLDDKVENYISAFADVQVLDSFDQEDSSYTTVPCERPLTVRHLLTHTSGIAYGGFNPGAVMTIYQMHELNNLGLSHPTWSTERIADEIADAPLIHQPGTRYLYGLNMEVLGRIIEVVSGTSLSAYFQKNIFDPLDMTDTHFYLPAEKHERLVPLYGLDEQGELRMATDQENTVLNYPLASDRSGYAGGGGLTSSCTDYLRFIQTLLDDGEYGDFELLSRRSIEVMTADQMIRLNEEGVGISRQPGRTFALGFSLGLDDSRGLGYKSPGTYEWGGYFNTKFFIDPAEELVFVGMTQMVPFPHQEFWERLYNVIYASLDD